MNTIPFLYPVPEFFEYFAAYLSNDPAKEPVALGSSIPGTIADAGVLIYNPQKLDI